MPKKKPTRRSISVKGTTYERLQRYCKKSKRSVSGQVEDLLADFLGAAGEPEVMPDELTPAKPRTDHPMDDTESVFTF